MKQKFLSLLLAVVLAVTSVDMTAFATEKENEEAVCTQVMDMETDDAAEQVEQTEQINQTEAADEIEVVEDMQLLEDVVTEEIKTMDDAQKEVFSESIDDKEDAVNVATEVWENYTETEKIKETAELPEDVGENSIDVSDEEKTEQTLKIENKSVEEIQTEEVETADGTEISEEMETADEDLMGNYTGTINASYVLEGISFSKAVIKVKPKSYTGKPVTIDAADITSATIKTGKKQIPLKFEKDFEIAAYSNNLKKGTATVTFRGIGAYAGEKTIKFKITPTAISGKNG